MATVFWDAQGVIMLDFLAKKSTITVAYYANLLDQLRIVIREKRRGKLSKEILLHQDNARVHTCKIAMDAVERNWYVLISHPAYSPDLAPSDYFLFPNLKKDIRGRHFRSNEEVVAAFEEWVREKGPWLLQFWADGTGTPLVQVHHSRGQLHRKKRSISPRNKLGWFFIDSPSYMHRCIIRLMRTVSCEVLVCLQLFPDMRLFTFLNDGSSVLCSRRQWVFCWFRRRITLLIISNRCKEWNTIFKSFSICLHQGLLI